MSASSKRQQAVRTKKLKPKVRRILEKREPKVFENTKSALFIRGEKTSETVNDALCDLAILKKPHAVVLSRKNKIYPFEDATTLENLCRKKDTSLFVFGSHSKKRPHNLVFGRTFDFQLLDLIEVGISDFKAINDFPKTKKSGIGMKPCFIFQGEAFEQNEDAKKLSNLLLDIFRGEELKEINLAGLEHIIICTAVGGVIHFRHYAILLKKSGTKFPRIELEEIGPHFDITIRRTKFASADLLKSALMVPKEQKKKKEKNLKSNVFGEELGRIHMPKQDLNQLETRKVKGLKRKRAEKEGESSSSALTTSKRTRE